MSVQSSKGQSGIYVGLADIIFGVIIGISFIEFKAILVPPSLEFKTALLLLAYVTIVASWVGYHRAAADFPYKNPSRFFIDLVLLYLYFYLAYSVDNFREFLFVFPLIFSFYLIWAFIRYLEYRKGETRIRFFEINVKVIRAYGILASSIIVFLGYDIYYSPEHEKVLLDATYVDWYAWISTFVLVIMYRLIPTILHPVIRNLVRKHKKR